MINYAVSECIKLTQNEYKTRHNWMEGDPCGIVEEIEIWLNYQMVDAQTTICQAQSAGVIEYTNCISAEG